MKRFWDKVNKDTASGCWEWAAFKAPTGYGQFRSNGKTTTAHRYSWELENGPIPDHDSYHGMCVCHTCDNRSCVNPDHLFLGTAQDNMTDKKNKGRAAKGAANGNSKLIEQDISRIRDMLRIGCKGKDIARWFGVGGAHISKIAHGRVWKQA